MSPANNSFDDWVYHKYAALLLSVSPAHNSVVIGHMLLTGVQKEPEAEDLQRWNKDWCVKCRQF
ncbi:MAG: hypothetical protein LBF72_00765 [Holosporales bacterium]|nr:hypothetical protein [Holosporales bacterium]